MVNIIDRVNPGYQRAIDEAGKKAWRKTEAKESSDSAAKTEEAKEESAAKSDVYVPEDKEAVKQEGRTYKPNTALVEQLKAEQASNQTRFVNMVKDMLGKQGKTIAEGEGFWKFLAGGAYEVDEESRKAAQEAIGEDGYWGVKQTSERIVNFAKALTGGDPEKIDQMRDAFHKGYAAAEKSWGGCLPGLANDTRSAVLKLFDEWENESKSEGTEESEDTADGSAPEETSKDD